MIEINEGYKSVLEERLQDTLQRYCPSCKNTHPNDIEKCDGCGSEIMENLFPDSGAHAYGVEWAIAPWVRQYGIRRTMDNYESEFEDWSNAEHGRVIIFDQSYCPAVVLRSIDADEYHHQFMNFMDRMIAEPDCNICRIDGDLFRLKPIDDVIESYHPNYGELRYQMNVDNGYHDADSCEEGGCDNCLDDMYD
jgi:hypothetical protein